MTLEFRSVIDKMTATPDRPKRNAPTPIRLSQNELPWGPPELVLNAMIEALQTVNRYPDYHRTAARAAVADAAGVPAEWVAVDNGSGSLLHGLARLVIEPGKNAVYGWPSFEAYPASVSLAGGTPSPTDLNAEGAMDLAALRASIDESTRLVHVCNPNNPTGGFIGIDELRDFMDSVPENILVVLDEAYREFVTAESASETIALVREFGNLAIVRTLSKSFGLAGVRAGYVIAQEPIALGLRRSSVGFALNSVAEAAIIAAFSPAGLAIAEARVGEIVAERERFLAALRTAGVSHLPTQSNFVFIHGDVADLTRSFEARGVMSRPFPHAGGVRITIGAPAENDAALAVFG
ncbi:aminotransferase class I/II-fold pyridoxal phosphate-dependent enzyme [Specibacter cremeus]|uniref:aminotransferase class I/II-fold pyridoxal phosphate-dependent enzyme n=1 Tax=Specibacter cremeus TaxID=1629051 RepID=UPI000F79DB1A|nr:aminotransferase class I/II-fold pyridoxal phosphate-dependent enzyme [Specibacter cremeus]